MIWLNLLLTIICLFIIVGSVFQAIKRNTPLDKANEEFENRPRVK